MILQLRRVLGLATATLLAVGSTMVAAPAHAAPGDGELTITVLDHTGKPIPALLQIISEDGYYHDSLAAPTGSITEETPPGRYGIMALSPQAGLLCVGIASCDILVGGSDYELEAGAIEVEEDGSASHTFRAPRPAVLRGSGKLGSTLAVQFSAPMNRLTHVYGAGYGGIGALGVEWLRNGAVMPAFTNSSYQVRRADVGHTIAPRIQISGLLTALFRQEGITTSPITLPGLKVDKVTPRVRTLVFRKNRVVGKRTGTRIDVVAPNRIVNGKVRIKVGKWKKTKRLANGSTRVRLPKLRAGKHKVKVTYLGNRVFAKAKAKNVVYKVKKKR